MVLRFVLLASPSLEGHPSLSKAWKTAIQEHVPQPSELEFTVVEGRLEDVPADVLRCDCMVSPANSFGIMDGG
jgi:hypothetical protein